MQRVIPLLTITIWLSGCSSLNPMNWWGDDDPVVDPPAELMDLSPTISIQRQWGGNSGGEGGERVHLVPFLYNNQIVTASHSGNVKVLDAANGHQLWSTDTGLEITGGPGAGEGLVLFGTRDAELVALEATTGQERWRASVTSVILSVPKVAHGVAVVHTIDGKLFGFDAANGEQLWFYDRYVPVLSLRGSGSPVISGSKVICGFANGKLGAFSLSDGQLYWESRISLPSGPSELSRMVDLDADPVINSGIVYVSTFQGDLAAVEEGVGTVLWRRRFSSYSGLDGDHHRIFATDEKGVVWAIDSNSGATIWKQEGLHGRGLSAPVLVDGYLLVGDYEGYVHGLSTSDGAVVGRTRVGSSPISAKPTVSRGIAYVLGEDGDLAALTVSRY